MVRIASRVSRASCCVAEYRGSAEACGEEITSEGTKNEEDAADEDEVEDAEDLLDDDSEVEDAEDLQSL